MQHKKRFPFVTAVHWFAFKDNQVLLARRFQTGYMDGYYSVPAGHVDGEETAREALTREIKEEVGVTLSVDDLQFAHVMHRNQVSEPHERIDFFFCTLAFTSAFKNCEPEKCDQLAWFSLDALPEKMVEYVRTALEHVKNEIAYSEHTEA